MDPSSSSNPSSNRQELIRNAVLFLNDPKVHSSSLTSRIQFLESKGLNEPEIQQALSQASNSPVGEGDRERLNGRPPNVPRYNGEYGEPYGYSTGMIHPPEPPRRDWRDLFIMAVISGGVVYGLTALAKKYLLPHLQPPSTTSFQDTSSALTQSYDEAAKLLTDLTDQTTKLQSSIEEDRERVGNVVGEVEEALRSVRDSEERWREEMRDMRSEVESVRELVPKMIEKHSASQSMALSDLQNELRSLKTLLLSRQNQNQGPSQAQSQQPQSNGSTQSGGISSTTAAANALLTPRGKGIPAWQLPSSSSSTGTPSGSSTPLNGSGILERGDDRPKEDGV
ncbi:uncharacterized protein IL334_007879 [Kwoniella shivajii]|uniref:Peroxisomal membrane protein PEX14 n=1 Tax=Kwoniella shivajii TaxID=564305 RepID=A0ABZ1DC01_9TREE|nr:hypothetical protein IL334_007879 [Kwoniella shivajii]